MSRRFPTKTTNEEPTGGLLGGGEGVDAVSDPNSGSATIHFPGKVDGAPSPPPSEEVAVKPSRFRVLGPGPSKDGSWPCLYNGLRIDLKPGKVFDDASYDVEKIRAQGVKLEEV